MSETPEQSAWYDIKSLLLAWILVLFPVGLYGLWKGQVFAQKQKIVITVLVVIVFALTGFKLIGPFQVLVCFPVALYLLWKAPEVTRRTTWLFAGAWAVVALLVLNEIRLSPDMPLPGSGLSGGSCSAVVTEGNCTYYRDDNCNVVARQCQ